MNQAEPFDQSALERVLFFVAAMPFATALLSEYPTSRLAVTVYVLVFAGLGTAKVGLWRHTVRHGLVDRSGSEMWSIGRRVWATPITADRPRPL